MNFDVLKILKNKIFLIILGIAMLILAISLVINNKNNNITNEENDFNQNNQNEVTKPSIQKETILTLYGDINIELEVGSDFKEPGYLAISDGKIKTNEVIVTNDINYAKPGNYTIKYQFKDITRYRNIKIKAKPVLESSLKLTLNGEAEIKLPLYSQYIEPGYTAYDTIDGNLTNSVVVSGLDKLDTTKIGTYYIYYQVKNSSGKTEVVYRTIKIIDDKLNIIIDQSPTTYTNQDINLSIKITGNEFAYLLLPNGIVVNKNLYNYQIKENGVYEFIAYNKNGQSFKKEVTINNIDRINPTATCTATIYQNYTNISVSANDNIGVKNYGYYDNNKSLITTALNTYKTSNSTSKNIFVKVYDLALNSTNVICKIIDNSYLEPIKPSSSENIILKEETDTLKVYITKEKTYYITRAWMKDPYNQVNKFDSPDYGVKMYTAKTLLTKAISKYNLENKLLVGFNASGFHSDKTSVGSVIITNGKVIRNNVYYKSNETLFIVGVNKENKLLLFKDEKALTNSAKKAKEPWAMSVIDSGIRNTFTFASPLVVDGVRSSITTTMPQINNRINRQAICQVNANNFVLVTGSNLNRNDLIDIMLRLKCQTALNLDGGSSIGLIFKPKNSTTIKTITGGGRALSEVGYFSE